MKVAAIVSTIEFQNRATIEAISKKYGNIKVFVKRNIKDLFKSKVKSDCVDIEYFYTIFPEKYRHNIYVNKMELFFSRYLLIPKIKFADVALLTNTHVAYLIPLLESDKKKIVSLFVDPYSIMNKGETKDDEVYMVEHSDLLLCTSKKLASDYCRKHLGLDKEGKYWPNTVDMSIWDISKFRNLAVNESGPYVFGYAGNMNEITIDLGLVESLLARFSDCKFIFAGRINFLDEDLKDKFLEILERDNVIFKGLIPYSQIQAEVASWDVCLMLDKVYEVSKYVHHNKVYQYLALGKVVIGTKTQDDYSDLKGGVYEGETIDKFLDCCELAIEESRDMNKAGLRVELAKANSSEVRADQFMKLLLEGGLSG